MKIHHIITRHSIEKIEKVVQAVCALLLKPQRLKQLKQERKNAGYQKYTEKNSASYISSSLPKNPIQNIWI